jgi:hypothetical protein
MIFSASRTNDGRSGVGMSEARSALRTAAESGVAPGWHAPQARFSATCAAAAGESLPVSPGAMGFLGVEARLSAMLPPRGGRPLDGFGSSNNKDPVLSTQT